MIILWSRRPVAVSSKRPTSRKRNVVSRGTTVCSFHFESLDGLYQFILYQKFRDPRFGPGSGDFSQAHFQDRYSFLEEMQRENLSQLRLSTLHTKKLLRSTPRHQRPDAEADLQQMESTVKRLESSLNLCDRLKKERRVEEEWSNREKLRRRQGKHPWYLKRGKLFSAICSEPSALTYARFL